MRDDLVNKFQDAVREALMAEFVAGSRFARYVYDLNTFAGDLKERSDEAEVFKNDAQARMWIAFSEMMDKDNQ